MTSYTVSDLELDALQGKNILITGAASGIGRAAVELAYAHGANIAIGDLNVKEVQSFTSSLDPSRIFVQETDVTSWASISAFFKAAQARFGGRIDSVLSNAGISSHDHLFTDEFDPATGELLAPNLQTLDVNLVGHVYATKLAMYYFRMQNRGEKIDVLSEAGARYQLVLTTSAGAYFPMRPLYLYCAAKAGVLGLMRGIRSETIKDSVSVNTIAPWLTVTPLLLPGYLDRWRAASLPACTPAGVARSLLLPIADPTINGKGFFVAGDKITEFEDTLLESEPLWMGAELCEKVDRGQELMFADSD